MSLATFTPEVWSQELLMALEKAQVIAADGVVNRDYEGEIAQAGDTVHINSIGDPTVATYTIREGCPCECHPYQCQQL